MAAAASPLPSAGPDSDHLPRPSLASPWDYKALCKRAETCELESGAFLIDPALLPTLEDLLLEIYAMLRPKPVDYEQRHIMIDVFNKIAKDVCGGKNNGFPVVEAFGSFTMDLFTAKSDLDLSVNFSSDMDGEFDRNKKISVIRKFAKVLRQHQSRGRCYGVLPVVNAIIPVLKVTDKGTGVECDISVENKDGMSRSMIFKLVSSIDERFRILCYLMKFWAKSHDVNCPRERTMSSMAIISLVAFHLQTRRPPILPAFSRLLKDGADIASIQRNVSLFEGFGSRNKESVAELFVSLMSKLLSVQGLWEQGLCASNLEGSWILKMTWDRGIGNLAVEDFLDRNQNFARSVGKVEMQTICECLRDTVCKLTDFFKGDIDAPTLKILIFGALKEDKPVSRSSPKLVETKRKRDTRLDPGNSQRPQKKGRHGAQPGRAADQTDACLPTPTMFMPPPPQVHLPRSQFARPPQHPAPPPSRFPYGPPLPLPHLHPAPHMVGQPQHGNFIRLNPRVQLHQQAQHDSVFVPLQARQQAINGFHPGYGFDGARQIPYDPNSGLPYINPNYRRV